MSWFRAAEVRALLAVLFLEPSHRICAGRRAPIAQIPRLCLFHLFFRPWVNLPRFAKRKLWKTHIRSSWSPSSSLKTEEAGILSSRGGGKVKRKELSLSGLAWSSMGLPSTSEAARLAAVQRKVPSIWQAWPAPLPALLRQLGPGSTNPRREIAVWGILSRSVC